MRAFDVLTKAEVDIRASMQPRYHLEMALLRWIHLRRLVPLTELIDQMGGRGKPETAVKSRPEAAKAPPEPNASTLSDGGRAAVVKAIEAKRIAAPSAAPPPRPSQPAAPAATKPDATAPKPVQGKTAEPSDLKEAFLSEIRKSKKFFHGTVVAQAQRIDVEADASCSSTLRSIAPSGRSWSRTAHRSNRSQASWRAGGCTIVAAEGTAGASPTSKLAGGGDRKSKPPRRSGSRPSSSRALADSGVQALLDVFAAEIKDVEEM